jgi:hypothetical protein
MGEILPFLRPLSTKTKITPFFYLAKVPLNVKIVQQDLLHRKKFLKFYEVRSERGGF